MKTCIGKIVISASIVVFFTNFAYAQSAAPFCERISSHEEAVHADFDSALRSRAELEKEQDMTLALDRAKQDESFAIARLDTDAQFVTYMETLQTKAGKDPVKKTAIEDFERTILASRRTFRSAVADIIKNFRTSMDTLVSARREGFVTAEKNRRDQFDAALETAKNSCANGNASSSTDDTLKTTLRGIRDGFRSELARVENTARADHHAAIEARKGALTVARTARKEAVLKAVEIFRTAWH